MNAIDIPDREPDVMESGPLIPPALVATLTSAVTWIYLTSVGGASLIVAGVFILAGLGWTCIASGLFLLLIAFVLIHGING